MDVIESEVLNWRRLDLTEDEQKGNQLEERKGPTYEKSKLYIGTH